MPAVAQHDKPRARNGLGDVGRTGDGDEIIVAMQDQWWDAQLSQRGQQIVSSRLIGLAPELISCGSCFEDTLLRPAHPQVLDQPVEQLRRAQGRAEIDAVVRGSSLEIIAFRKPWTRFQDAQDLYSIEVTGVAL